MSNIRNLAVLSSWALFCLCTAVSSGHLFGRLSQSITGRVTDSLGAAVPGALLTVKNTATSASQTVNSDEQGRYSVPDLPLDPTK